MDIEAHSKYMVTTKLCYILRADHTSLRLLTISRDHSALKIFLLF